MGWKPPPWPAFPPPGPADTRADRMKESYNPAMAPTPLRIGHVINPLAAVPGSDLLAAQPITFESMRRAIAFSSGTDVEIEVVAAVLPEDRGEVPQWMKTGRPLGQTVQDVGSFATARRLPLLRDVLDRLNDCGPFDVGIYTNVDIALQPHFYDFVARTYRSGFDAFSINRRTVIPVADPVAITELYAATGLPHNGHDCFIFPMTALDDFELDDVCIGAPPVGRLLLVNLIAASKRFREFRDEHLTFHVGNDRIWLNVQNREYREHNIEAARRAVAGLQERFPDRNVESLDYVGRLLPRGHIRRGKKTPGSRVRPHQRRQMIFCINPGRSGSRYLARLLDTAPEVTAEHMADPQMIGEELRRVMDGAAPTGESRWHKGDALARRLEQLPPGSIYADTSHMFIKTWSNAVLRRFPESSLRVVVLRRDVIATAASFLRLGCFAEGNPDWGGLLHLPTARNSLVREFLEVEPSDQFELIVGYLLDIELRAQKWLADHPERTVEVWLEDLQEMNGVSRLFQSLEITPTDQTLQFLGTREEDQGHPMPVPSIEVSSDEVVNRVSAILQRFKDGGGPLEQMLLFH